MSLVNRAWGILIFLLWIVFPVKGRAQLYLDVRENLPLYEKPNINADQLGLAEVGERLETTGKRNSDFIEVLDGEGRKRYVYRKEMVKSRLTKAESNKLGRRPHKSWAVGLAYSRYSQADRAIQTASDTYYDASEFVGYAPFLWAQFEYFVNDVWAAQGYLGYRELVMEGDATLRGSMGAGTTSFKLTQDFISLGVGLKRYFGDRLWLGGFFELAKGIAVDLQVTQGTPVTTDGISKPFFTVCTGAVGYDLYIGKSRMQLQFRGGAIPFADPFIMVFEGAMTYDLPFLF